MSNSLQVYDLPPEKHKFILPDDGCKGGQIWIVEVACNKNNPIHRAILHVGFMDSPNEFGGYCEVWCNNYDQSIPVSSLHYLKLIKLIGNLDD